MSRGSFASSLVSLGKADTLHPLGMINIWVPITLELAVDDFVPPPLCVINGVEGMPVTHDRLEPGVH